MSGYVYGAATQRAQESSRQVQAPTVQVPAEVVKVLEKQKAKIQLQKQELEDRQALLERERNAKTKLDSANRKLRKELAKVSDELERGSTHAKEVSLTNSYLTEQLEVISERLKTAEETVESLTAEKGRFLKLLVEAEQKQDLAPMLQEQVDTLKHQLEVKDERIVEVEKLLKELQDEPRSLVFEGTLDAVIAHGRPVDMSKTRLGEFEGRKIQLVVAS